MRQEPYADAYDRSARHKGDRVTHRPRSLTGYLRWARHQWQLETPDLDHSQSLVADDGDPEMKSSAQRYLGLSGAPSERPDDWRSIAGRVDRDGFYVTPMRYALECIRSNDRKRAEFLTTLVVNVYEPFHVALYYGIPGWCAADVTLRSLRLLWDRYTELPIPRQPGPTWVDKSDAQRSAEEAA